MLLLSLMYRHFQWNTIWHNSHLPPYKKAFSEALFNFQYAFASLVCGGVFLCELGLVFVPFGIIYCIMCKELRQQQQKRKKNPEIHPASNVPHVWYYNKNKQTLWETTVWVLFLEDNKIKEIRKLKICVGAA